MFQSKGKYRMGNGGTVEILRIKPRGQNGWLLVGYFTSQNVAYIHNWSIEGICLTNANSGFNLMGKI